MGTIPDFVEERFAVAPGIFAQVLAPVLHDVKARLLEIGVFEDGIGGPDGGGRIVGRGAGAHLAIQPHGGDEFLGEVVPGAKAFAGGVEQSGGVGFGHGQDLLGEAAGPGGGAELVIHDAQSFLGFVGGPAQDGFEEVVAVGTIEPGRAQNGVAWIAFLDLALAGKFALAVDADGIGCVGLDIGLRNGPRPVEDVVGGDMDEEDAVGLGAGGEQGRAVAVHVPGLGDIGFGAINGGVGGAVDQHIGLP